MRTPREILVFAGMMIAASMLARGTVAQMPDGIAAPGETVVATLHAEGAAGLRVQDRRGRQARVAVPRARRHAAPGGQDGGSSLRGADLGACRRQRRGRQGGGAGAGGHPQDIPWLRLDVTERRGSGRCRARRQSSGIHTQGRRRRRRLRQGPARIGASPMPPTTCSSEVARVRGGRHVSEHQDAVQLRRRPPPRTRSRASSVQFVRKLSGFNRPSKANQVAFDRAVEAGGPRRARAASTRW